ncbi:hypothetical protein GBA52_002816 [Prunus armeniaca]|nr:hypothetical protein GBA52_002816 [Prunus armeniaca]
MQKIVTLLKVCAQKICAFVLSLFDISFFDREAVGDLTSRLGADCQRLSLVIANDISLILRNVLQVFATPEASIGFHTDCGFSYVSHLPGHLGEFFALTGARLNGKELVAAGLATHFVTLEVGLALGELRKENNFLRSLWPIIMAKPAGGPSKRDQPTGVDED